MQEDFLHYIWKHKAFTSSSLKTTSGEQVLIKQLGQHNLNSGPDFFNAHLRINDQLWAGNVEIHIKSSDWYVHNHEIDKAYDNVILHVVWVHDTEIFRKDNTPIPTLELKPFVEEGLAQNYHELLASKRWINCESDFPEVDDFLLNNWLERLFIERLERKSSAIKTELKAADNNWDAVLFKMLLKNFGLKVNGEAFFSIANSVDFSIVRKLQKDVLYFEAFLFGQSGLLDNNRDEPYFMELHDRYSFIKRKYQFDSKGVVPVQFFRLRPPNFPTIRLSQFANLYSLEPHLFSKIIDAKTKADYYKLLGVGVTEFWMTHYTFTKSSKVSKKVLTKSFIDLIIINTIIPLKFCYAASQDQSVEAELLELIKELKIESNSTVSKFLSLKSLPQNALISQALLQLKMEYCDKNKCLQCAIGSSLILRN